MTADRPATLPRAWLLGGAAAAVLAATATAVAVVALAPKDPAQQPDVPTAVVSVETVPPDAAAEEHCPGLMAALPEVLADGPARRIASVSPYAAAWGEPPVVLRCGVPLPAALTPTSSLLTVNGVDWFQEASGDLVVWTSVGRAVAVDVTVPADREDQEAVLVPVSDAVAAAVPAA